MITIGRIERKDGISKFVLHVNFWEDLENKWFANREKVRIEKVDKFPNCEVTNIDADAFIPDIIVVNGKRYEVLDIESNTDGTNGRLMVKETDWEGK